MNAPTLFDLPEPPQQDCVRNGPCKTCGAVRPPDYPGEMFLEPVSFECLPCNQNTLMTIVESGRQRDRIAYDAAWAQHYRGRVSRG